MKPLSNLLRKSTEKSSKTLKELTALPQATDRLGSPQGGDRTAAIWCKTTPAGVIEKGEVASRLKTKSPTARRQWFEPVKVSPCEVPALNRLRSRFVFCGPMGRPMVGAA